jgi:hypothetical protein
MDCPLPTIMEDGGDGRWERSIPLLEDMWDVAPLSITQGEDPCTASWLRAAIRPAAFQPPGAEPAAENCDGAKAVCACCGGGAGETTGCPRRPMGRPKDCSKPRDRPAEEPDVRRNRCLAAGDRLAAGCVRHRCHRCALPCPCHLCLCHRLHDWWKEKRWSGTIRRKWWRQQGPKPRPLCPQRQGEVP